MSDWKSDSLAKALYDEFGMNLNPADPSRYWRFAAEGIRRRWLVEHDAAIRAEQIEVDAEIAERVNRIGHNDSEVRGFEQASSLIAQIIRAQLKSEGE